MWRIPHPSQERPVLHRACARVAVPTAVRASTGAMLQSTQCAANDHRLKAGTQDWNHPHPDPQRELQFNARDAAPRLSEAVTPVLFLEHASLK